jgi:hypothetical protein
MRLNNAVIHRTMWLTSTQPTHSLNPAAGGPGRVDPSSAMAGETSVQQPGRTCRVRGRCFLFGRTWQGAALGLLLSLVSLLCLSLEKAKADGVGNVTSFTGVGNIPSHGFRISEQDVFAYVAAGEKLRFDVRLHQVVGSVTPTAADDLEIRVYSPTGQVGTTLTIDGLAAMGTLG